MEQLQNYIGGKMSEPASRKYLENFDPSNGSVYSLIPDSDELEEPAKKLNIMFVLATWNRTQVFLLRGHQ